MDTTEIDQRIERVKRVTAGMSRTGWTDAQQTGMSYDDWRRSQSYLDQLDELMSLRQRVINAEIARLQSCAAASAIPKEYLGKTLDNFEAVRDDEKAALELCQKFVRNYDTIIKPNGYGLLFFGGVGTGKSHLTCGILNALLGKETVLYTTVQRMIRSIRRGWDRDSDVSESMVIDELCRVGLLAIDEIGVQAGSDSERQHIFDVIDARLASLKPTIFLTNLLPTDLVRYLGDRAIDRIKGKCVVIKLEGRSHRKSITADVFGD